MGCAPQEAAPKRYLVLASAAVALTFAFANFPALNVQMQSDLTLMLCTPSSCSTRCHIHKCALCTHFICTRVSAARGVLENGLPDVSDWAQDPEPLMIE